MMNKNKTRVLQAGMYVLFFVAFFGIFYFGLRDVLQGWEEHHPLFRYSPDYVLRYRYEYLNVILFCNAFLVQFAYYPALGALLYAALFTLLAFGINCLALGRTASAAPEAPAIAEPLCGFGITACLLPMFAYTFCVWPIILLLITAGGFLWRATMAHKPHHIALRELLMIALTYILREYAVLAWVLYSLIDATRFVPASQAPPADRPRRAPRFLFYLVGWIVILAVFVALWRPYLFILKSRILSFYTTEADNILRPPFSFFRMPVYVLILFYLGQMGFLFQPWMGRIQKKARTALCIVVACVGVTGISLTPSWAHQNTVFFKADHHIRRYQWKEAMAVLEKDYPRHEGKQKVDHAEMAYQAQLKLCLLALRKANDQLFTYNLAYFPLLFPGNIINRVDSYEVPPYYVYCGNYSASLHLDYDWCTGGNISPAMLGQLLTASFILGDTLPASKFLYLLNQTLFRQKDVAKYSVQNPEFARILERGKKLLPTSNYRIDAYIPDRNAIAAYLHNPGNALFYEYFLAIYLANKDIYMINAEWDKIKQSYLHRVPRHLQEALLATYGYAPARYLYPKKIDGIEADTWNDYWAFIIDDQAYRNNKITIDELERKWRHTFWFHHLYILYKYA